MQSYPNSFFHLTYQLDSPPAHRNGIYVWYSFHDRIAIGLDRMLFEIHSSLYHNRIIVSK